MAGFLGGLERFIGMLTWPIVILIALLVYRRALAALFTNIGSRVTKLSIFKVELELAAAESRAPSIVLNELRDTSQAAIADSAQSLFAQLQDTNTADFAIIDLGFGNEWITSRLFIAAALLERMRGLRAMVFTEFRELSPGYCLAVESPSVVRWALARKYPWLELAYSIASERTIAPGLPSPNAKTFVAIENIITSDRGTLGGELAKRLTREYLSSLQDFTGNPPPPTPDEWVELRGYRERAAWVTSRLLREILPPLAFDQQMNEMRDDAQARRVRAVLRRPGQFVALVDSHGGFKRLVDRGVLLEQAAVQLSDEPVG